MIKYICDKCGEDISVEEAYTISVKYPMVRVWGDDIYTNRDFHMCRDCMTAVEEFVKTKIIDCPSL